MSNLLQRMMLAVRAGFQFGGKRKLYDVFGYPATLTSTHLWAKYQRQDLASRIVDMPPEEMWSQPPTLIAPTQTARDRWTEFVARTGYWEKVIQADKLLSFGRFSGLLLGLRGALNTRARRLDSIDAGVDVGDILYLQAYGTDDSISIKSYEDDPTNPRFGQPVMYDVNVGLGGVDGTKTRKSEVHYSRIIHIVDRPVQGGILSEPRLVQIYNVLEDILKVAGGSAETYWLTGNRGMQVDVDKEMDLRAEDAAALEEELNEFQHQLRRYVRTRGVTITPLGSDVADPRGVFEVLISILSGSTSIPQRILMGSEAGQLASEQDRANWSEYIERRRKVFGEPYVLRPTLLKLEELGYLREGTAAKSTWKWPQAFHMSPLEEANTMASKARSVVNLSRRIQFGNPLVSDEEVRTMLGLPEKLVEGHTMPEMPGTVEQAGDDQAHTPPGPGNEYGPGRQRGASPVDAPATITEDDDAM